MPDDPGRNAIRWAIGLPPAAEGGHAGPALRRKASRDLIATGPRDPRPDRPNLLSRVPCAQRGVLRKQVTEQVHSGQMQQTACGKSIASPDCGEIGGGARCE